MSKERKAVAAKDVRKELLPEQSLEVLKALHLVTRDGNLNADARRKLKQVNHLVGLLQPGLDDRFAHCESPLLVDVGSGNAYLGFVLYELFFRQRGEVVAVEQRAELGVRAKERATALGFSRLRFVTGEIGTATYPAKIDILCALHACDTATDDALRIAVAHDADWVAVVPCCQAEVARQLKDAPTPLVRSLAGHPLHRREFGSHLTNVVRALWLESHGYKVTVTELSGWEHSLKNELILGHRVQRSNAMAKAELELLLTATGICPKLVQSA